MKDQLRSDRVGHSYKNRQGLDVVVVEYLHNKNVIVEFEDKTRLKTTWMYIKQGKPLHPTVGRIVSGNRYQCKDGDSIIILEGRPKEKFLVQWESDGYIGETHRTTILNGGIRHPTKNKPQVGSVWKTNCGLPVTVGRFNSAISVDVVFEDGSTTNVSVHALTRGIVGHPSSKLYIGKEFTTNSGWSGYVAHYNSPHDVGVKWQDGSTSVESAAHILNGAIKPLMQPSVEGIGYFGVGRFSPSSYKGGVQVPEKIRGYWMRMFSRVYNPLELNKNQNAQYRDCFIDERFHSLQEFTEWMLSSSDNWMLDKMELDKDLMGTGKLYSPEFCTILPSTINKFLLEQDCGNTMKGVNIILPKPGTNATVGYIARCSVEGDRKYLGFYKTEVLAFNAYKEFKEQAAKMLAEKYKDFISKEAYTKLKQYQVTP
jgi:ribosomal protein S17